MSADLHHATAIDIAVAPDRVVAFLASAEEMTRWSFGTWTIAHRPDGLVEGRSLFTGAPILVRIEADVSARTVRWWLGSTPEALEPRIVAHVTPGPREDTSVLTLLGWRTPAMDDHRWRRLKASHELEICLIKDILESRR